MNKGRGGGRLWKTAFGGRQSGEVAMSFDGGTRRTTDALLAIAWWILGTLTDRYILQMCAPESLQSASLLRISLKKSQLR
jgi:hypothetical protein